MAAEFEQLRLSVNLTDNASAGLAQLRNEIAKLGGGSGGAQIERFKKQTDDLTRKIKELGGVTGDAGKAIDFFVKGVGAAGVGMATFGGIIGLQLRSLEQYADRITKLGNAARNIGISPAALKNITSAFARVGV